MAVSSALVSRTSDSPRPIGTGTEPSKPAATRIGELDALRGIAAMAVVLHHLTRRFYEDFGTPAGALPAFPVQGVQGVFLFFVISGFVISQTLHRTRHAGDFLVSRFSRIFPCFWISALLTYGVVSLAGLPGRDVSLRDALLNLTMLQDHFRVASVDLSYWSLTIELSFYAIAWVAHLRGWLGRSPHGFAWLWLAGSAAWVAAWRGWGFTLPENLQFLILPRYAPLFVAGIMFYLLHGGRGSRRTHAVIAACYVLHNAIHWAGKTGLLMSLGMFLCFCLVAEGRLGFLRVRPLLFLGAISYPLYLLHNNIGMVLLRAQLAAGIAYGIAFVVTLGAIVGLAATVHQLVEKPAMRWIRRHWESRPAGAS